MTERPDDGARDLQKLEELIRAASELDDEEVPEIDPNTLIAYLRGQASGDEREQVQRALAGSAAFRQQLLELSNELDELAQPEMAAAFAKAHPPRIPEMPAEYLGSSDGDARTVASETEEGWLARLWAEISDFQAVLRWGGGLAGAAATAGLILMLARIPYAPVDFNVVSVDAVQTFGSIDGRAPGGTARDVRASNHLDAAVEAFRRAVVLKEDVLRFWSEYEPQQPVEGGRLIQVRVRDTMGQDLTRVEARLPREARPEVALHGWVLSLREPIGGRFAELRHFEVSRDQLQITWPAEMGARGCLTFTYKSGDAFKASDVIFIDVRSSNMEAP